MAAKKKAAKKAPAKKTTRKKTNSGNRPDHHNRGGSRRQPSKGVKPVSEEKKEVTEEQKGVETAQQRAEMEAAEAQKQAEEQAAQEQAEADQKAADEKAAAEAKAQEEAEAKKKAEEEEAAKKKAEEEEAEAAKKKAEEEAAAQKKADEEAAAKEMEQQKQGGVQPEVSPLAKIEKLLGERKELFKGSGAINNKKAIEANLGEMVAIAHDCGEPEALEMVAKYLQQFPYQNGGCGDALGKRGSATQVVKSLNATYAMLTRIAQARTNKSKVTLNDSLMAEIISDKVSRWIRNSI